MSRWNSVRRAANTAQARRRGFIRVQSGPEAEQTVDEYVARAKALAPRFGFCGWCGVTVDEANGKLHAHDCGVETERREVSEDKRDFADEYARASGEED